MSIVAYWYLGTLTALCLPIAWLSPEGEDGMTPQGIAMGVFAFVVLPSYVLATVVSLVVLIVLVCRSEITAIRANIVAVISLPVSFAALVGTVYALIRVFG